MRMRFVVALAVVCAGTGYFLWQRHQAIAAAEGREAGMLRQRAVAASGGAATLSAVRENLQSAYRLPPDRRCLAAAALLRPTEGLADAPALATRHDDAKGGWTVLSGTQVLAELPELPDIVDCYRVLGAVIGASTQPPVEDASTPVSAVFAGPDKLLEALRALDDGSPITAWPADRLEQAATAAVYLQLQGMDLLDVDAQMPALALALDALVTQRAGVVRLHRRALLAHLLGYHGTAQALAARLGETDPVRLFVLRDDAALYKSAASLYTHDLLNYLVLRRMGERQDYEGWSGWMRRYTLRDMPAWSVWQTTVSLDSFRQQRVADVVPYILAMQMRYLVHRETMNSWFARVGLKSAPTSALALLEALEKTAGFSAGVLNEFENALADWSARFQGRVVTNALVQSYFKAYFYSTVVMAGRHRLDSLGSIPAAKAWQESIAKSTTEIGKAYAEWYGHLVAIEEDQTDTKTLLKALGQASPLGVAPRRRLFGDMADRYLPFGSHANRAALRAIVPHLDSRPAHAYFLSDQLRDLLFELNQSERLFEYGARNRAADDVSDVLWAASMRGDAATLRAVALNPQVRLKDRRYAISLLDNPLKEPPDALDAAHAAVHRDGLKDFDTVRWFANRALDRGRPADARDAALAWLKLELKDPGLERVIMHATLSRAYFALAEFENAWNAVEPAFESGQGGALRAGAWAAAHLNRPEDAQRIWDHVRKTYGSSPGTQLDYLEFLWDQRRYRDAADVLVSWPHALRTQDWALTIAPAFEEATRGWPDGDIIAAFDAIKAKRISGHFLTYLPAKFSKAGRHGLALQMRRGLQGPGLANVELIVEAYRDLRAEQGPEAALAWARKAIPRQVLDPSSMVFFKMGEPELLWELIDSDHEWVWLIRAASAVRDGQPSAKRRDALRRYFEDDGEDPLVQLLGRYLLGLATEEEVLQHPWPADRWYEAAYFMGLKNQCEQRLSAAADWYQVVVELSKENKGEFHWAQNQLYAWHSAGQVLSRLPSGCGAPAADAQRPVA